MKRCLVLPLVFLLFAAVARAEPASTYVVAIGNNAPPEGGEARGLTWLRFADDDAVAVAGFAAAWADEVHLLSVLDRDTQALAPHMAEAARAPSLKELRRTVEYLQTALERDRAAGREAEVVIFFSGHGSRGEQGRAAGLALLDGELTQARLYGDILARLPARRVHLLVDACHAEAVVRPRDADLSAEIVEVSQADVEAWAERSTLRRFPHVGAVIATATDQQAHEWDAYQGGVFTHQLLSGLRGGADVDGNGRVEYAELHAFLAAANSGISNPRARLQVIVQPPALDLRAALVRLDRLHGVGWLVGPETELGRFHVEDAAGTRLADLNLEPAHQVRLALPAGEPLLLCAASGEASFSLDPGAELAPGHLAMSAPRTAARGAVDTALRRGLFATPFGPLYYRGFLDRTAGPGSGLDAASVAPPPSRVPAWIAFAAAGALTATAGVTGGLALDARADYAATDLQRPAAEARGRYDRFRYAALGTGVAALVAAGVGVWLAW